MIWVLVVVGSEDLFLLECFVKWVFRCKDSVLWRRRFTEWGNFFAVDGLRLWFIFREPVVLNIFLFMKSFWVGHICIGIEEYSYNGFHGHLYFMLDTSICPFLLDFGFWSILSTLLPVFLHTSDPQDKYGTTSFGHGQILLLPPILLKGWEGGRHRLHWTSTRSEVVPWEVFPLCPLPAGLPGGLLCSCEAPKWNSHDDLTTPRRTGEVGGRGPWTLREFSTIVKD